MPTADVVRPAIPANSSVYPVGINVGNANTNNTQRRVDFYAPTTTDVILENNLTSRYDDPTFYKS